MSVTLKRILAVCLGCACLGMSGCMYHSKHDTYDLISINQKLPYWKTVYTGFSKAASDYGVTAQLMGPNDYDPQAELQAFKQAVAAKPAGILISIADANLLREEVGDAIGAGIPVITVDSDAPVSARLFFIGTNNLAAGHLGGQRLVEKMKDKGNVAFYMIAGQPNLEERLKGYKDILANHPGIRIAEGFDTKGDSGNAFDQTEKDLGKTGADKIDAFVSLESTAGKSIADVLKGKGVTDRLIIAMDVDPDTLNLIKNGSIDSTVSQKPFTMGYVGLKMLDEIHHNLPKPFQTNYGVDSFARYPMFVDTGTAIVDKNNVSVYLEGAADAEGK